MEQSKKDKVKAIFETVLSKKILKELAEDNWMDFDIYQTFNTAKTKLIPTNIFEMNFFEKDGKGDKVCYNTIFFDSDNKLFWSENIFDEEETKYETFSELKKHLENIEDDILGDGEPVITFR